LSGSHFKYMGNYRVRAFCLAITKAYQGWGMSPISGTFVPNSEITYSDRFRDRLNVVIDTFGSLAKAGAAAGVSDEQVARWRDGKAKPNFFALATLTYNAGRSLDWLLGDAADDLVAPGSALAAREETAPKGFSLVPKLDVQASAGAGRLALGEDPLEYLAFQSTWLKSRGINPVSARILTARGDSMEETIRDGDALLVDTSIDRIKDNAIYVVIYGDMVLVKRVHGRLNGSLQLISDNPRYPPEEVTSAEVDQLNIAGRVMWFGRTI